MNAPMNLVYMATAQMASTITLVDVMMDMKGTTVILVNAYFCVVYTIDINS